MKRNHGFPVLVLLLLLSPGVMKMAGAEPLTLESYFEVTLARLDLVVGTWEQTGHGPGEEEEAVLFQQHGITTEAFYGFAGEHREEIAAYLEGHPDVQQAIDDLSARIQQLVAQAEEQ